MTRSRAYLPLSQNFGGRSVGFSRATYAHFPVVKGLMAYWPFIEGAGAAVKDYWGTNNGTLNQIDNWSTGRWGNGYDFDGVDDYVDVGVINVGEGSNWTVCAWIKTGVGSPSNNVIYAENDVGGGDIFIILRVYNTKAEVVTGDGVETKVTSTTAVNDNLWHFVVGVRAGSSVMIYVDGHLENTGAARTPSNIDSAGIGAIQWGIGNWTALFDGIIDEVCVWNRALKLSEIVSMMWRRREGCLAGFNLAQEAPTSCDAGWTDCANAQTDDAAYAVEIVDAVQCVWDGFGFSIPGGSSISSVKVKVKTYTGDDAKHSIPLEVWNGASWGAPHGVTPTEIACTEETINVTGDFAWTPAMVNAIKVRLTANIGGGPGAKKWVRCCFIQVEVKYR